VTRYPGRPAHAGQVRLGGLGEDPDNVAASRGAGTPARWTTFGVDARVLTGTAPPGATSRLRTVTGQDAFVLGPLGWSSGRDHRHLAPAADP
jgi:hypothetical protein